MVLRTKTLIFLWFTERSDFKGVLKNQYVGGDCLKRGGGLGQFVDLRGVLARKRGWCF